MSSIPSSSHRQVVVEPQRTDCNRWGVAAVASRHHLRTVHVTTKEMAKLPQFVRGVHNPANLQSGSVWIGPDRAASS